MTKKTNRAHANASQPKKPVKSAAKKAMLDPVTAQAVSNGARLDRGDFEVQPVPNPHGEVMKDGQPVRHLAVRRKPQYELLRTRRVITSQQAGALAWYADRLALADSGMVRNPLGSNGGGSTGAGIPISEARMDALRDVDWARSQIGDKALLDIFDAVMADEITFVEAARRECAKRYVRMSVRRQQDRLRDLFVRAASFLEEAHAQRYRLGTGRIEGSNDGESNLAAWFPSAA